MIFFEGVNYDSDEVSKLINSNFVKKFPKETASGDILFLFDNLKVLIESKNVQVLKKMILINFIEILK